MEKPTAKSTIPVIVDFAGESPIQVLHVDHEPAFLKVVKEFLEKEQAFEVNTATSIDEAAAKLKNGVYDVVISDHEMPTGNGLEFLRELRNDGNNIPFIMLTEESPQEVIAEALNLGADLYVEKVVPLEPACIQLLHGIRQAVARKQAERRLRESEEKYRSLFELAPDSILTFDPKGFVTSTNRTATKALGYSKQELVGEHISELSFLQGKDVPKILESFQLTIEGDEPKPFETTWRRKGGAPFFTEVHMSLMKAGGKTTGIQTTARDITARAQAREKFQRLFMNSPEAAVYLGPSFQVLAINPLFTELFGYTSNEVKEKLLNDLVVPEDKTEEARMLADNAKKGYVYYDTTRKRKDGRRVLVSISAAPIIVEDILLGIVELYRDISQRKRAERGLQRAMEKLEVMNEKLRVVGELTRHDVRNKLSAITGNLHLLRKKLKDQHDGQEHFQEIRSAVEQISAILDLARAYERLGAEKPTLMEVGKSVEDALQLFKEPKGISVEIDCNGLAVLADSSLMQLFYNLIDNSVKHGQRVSRIRVSFKQLKDDQLQILYEDDGIGIPPAKKDIIFAGGYGQSAGHGLHLIAKMCEVYGWTVSETGEEREGVRFIMTIPRIGQDGKEKYRVGGA